MRDLFHNTKTILALIAANITADATGVVIDRQGFESFMMTVNLGNSGDTLSGAVFHELKLQHGSLADGSDMAAVPEVDMLGGVAGTITGLFALINAPAEDSLVFKVGYRGAKRYVRVFVDTTGTHTVGTPVSATAILGRAANAPVA